MSGGGSTGGCSGSNGTAGSLGFGGIGGGAPSGEGGGGGGGGYYGGGGGASPIPAAGGGGGSSFIAQGTLIATPTSAPAGVTITYDAPTADLSAPSITFADTEPEGLASSEEDETVSNNGSAPLVVSAVALAGSDPGDFLIDDGCQQPVAVGSSCQIGVRFDPETQGVLSATMTLTTNAATQPAAIDLSGTGGPLPTGPQGPAGSQGPAGPQGPPGPAGQVVCRDTLLAKALCTLEFAPGTYTVQDGSAKPRIIHANLVIERSGRRIRAERITAETGKITDESIGRLVPGRYTLTVSTGRGQRRKLLLTDRFQVR